MWTSNKLQLLSASLSFAAQCPRCPFPCCRTTIYPTPFPGILAYSTLFTRSFPNVPPTATAVDASSLKIKLDYDTLEFTDVLMQASDAPPPPEARGVVIQPPTLCANGAAAAKPLAGSTARVNALFPLFPVTASQQLATSMAEIVRGTYLFPPLIMVFANVTLLGFETRDAILTSDLLLAGPTGGAAGEGNPTGITLDLSQVKEPERL